MCIFQITYKRASLDCITDYYKTLYSIHNMPPNKKNISIMIDF